MELYLGKKKPEGPPIWRAENHTVSERLLTQITFKLPDHYSHEDDEVIQAFLFLQKSEEQKTNQFDFQFQFNLAERRMIRTLPRQERFLLERTEVNQDEESEEKEREMLQEQEQRKFNSSLPYLHWKFSYAPLIVRYVSFYETVDTKTYHNTFLQPMRRQRNPNTALAQKKSQKKGKREAEQVQGMGSTSTHFVYNPLLWLDDLSITTRHYQLITSLPPANSPHLSTSSTTTATTGSPLITISFQYLPTSPLHYFFKHILALVIRAFTLLSALLDSSTSSSDPSPLSLSSTNLQSLISSLSTNTPLPLSLTSSSSLDPLIDELRYYLSDDHLYLLLLSSLIAYLHFYLEYLIFTADYQYFVSTSRAHRYKGISLSATLYAFYRSVVLFAYLSHSSSSAIILFSVAKDVLYSLWKLLHLVSHLLRHRVRFFTLDLSSLAPLLNILTLGMVSTTALTISFPVQLLTPVPAVALPAAGDKKRDGEAASEGEGDLCLHYDYIASVHALLSTFPLLLGLSLYNLITYPYPSWYNWLLNTLMDSIYYFGFLSMIPQLFINYKLHSVAHLPIRVLFYKLFQTIIDDVFALLVKMPWKHKLMTLRDDLIFVVFIYQWWVYPSDGTRVNEYGYQYTNTANSETNTATAVTTNTRTITDEGDDELASNGKDPLKDGEMEESVGEGEVPNHDS
jgi:hypothetical protein